MRLPYVDIHTHHPNLDPDIFQIWNQVVGIDVPKNIQQSAGIHPWYINTTFETQFSKLESLAIQQNTLAIGECGLDTLCDTPFEEQIMAFERQIQLANKIKKPLIIHCVRAYDKVLEILKKQKNNVPTLFHGVNKKHTLIKSLHQKGYYNSLGSYILQGYHDDTIKHADLTKIFLETDDNTTSIVDIYCYFCRVRNINIEELQHQIVQNVSNVFNYNIVPQ